MFLFTTIAQAGKPQPSAQGKWTFTFAGGTTINNGAVNIVQDAHGNLNSPFFAGYVGGAWYQNYEAFSDSTCSPSGWAPVQPTGSNVNGSFNFRLQVNTGIFYDLKGSVSDNGTTMAGSFTSNCSSDHGTFTGQLYAPVNKTYIGIVNGSNDDGTVTQYNATLVLTEDAHFNVTGSILLNTPSGTATCYGTIQLSGPATGDFIELGGTNGNVVHYNGTSWSAPLTVGNADVAAIWGTSTSDVYLVNRAGSIWHYNGSTWVRYRNQADSYVGVWGSGRTDVWVVGSDTAFKLNKVYHGTR